MLQVIHGCVKHLFKLFFKKMLARGILRLGKARKKRVAFVWQALDCGVGPASRMRPTAFPDTPSAFATSEPRMVRSVRERGASVRRSSSRISSRNAASSAWGCTEFQGRKLRMLQREQVAHERCVAAFEDSKGRDAAGRGRDVFIVTNYDSADFFAKAARGFQFFQERLGAQSAFFRVVFRVVEQSEAGVFALSRSRAARRKEGSAGVRSKTCAVCSRMLQVLSRKFKGCVAMALALDYDVEDIVVFQKDGGSTGRAQKRAQLGENPLFRQRLQKRSILADCVFRSMLDGKSQLCGEAKTPHDTKRVFGKAVEGVADCAKAAFSDVVKSSEGVEKAAGRMEGHGVDAEITPRGRLLWCRRTLRCRDAARRCILRRRGRLFTSRGTDSTRTVTVPCFAPRLHDVMAGLLEERARFLPRRRSGYVAIVGLDSHERVANASSDEPGAMAGFFKLVQDVERPCIDRYVGGKIAVWPKW